MQSYLYWKLDTFKFKRGYSSIIIIVARAIYIPGIETILIIPMHLNRERGLSSICKSVFILCGESPNGLTRRNYKIQSEYSMTLSWTVISIVMKTVDDPKLETYRKNFIINTADIVFNCERITPFRANFVILLLSSTAPFSYNGGPRENYSRNINYKHRLLD